MQKKILTSIGLMSGTSMDGVDISVIRSDGFDEVEVIFNDFYEFNASLYSELINLRGRLIKHEDLKKFLKDIREIEREFTIFNSNIVNTIIKKNSLNVDLIGFHGQTILHLPNYKISEQLGDGGLLSQLTQCKVVNKFRQKDLDSGGQGAPLTPIFHNSISKMINKKFRLDYPMDIINIGGITNVSKIINKVNLKKNLFAYDIAPGNCLIDEWIRKNSKYKYDKDGLISKSGKVNELILNQALDNYSENTYNSFSPISFDIKDFDISFVRGLSLEDGAATLTHLTARLIGEGLVQFISKNYPNEEKILSKAIILVCGGGRKNKHLIEILKKNLNVEKIGLIDDYGYDGSFIESQAFGFLAIRSYLGLPISFPNTTGCKEPTTGGLIVKNY